MSFQAYLNKVEEITGKALHEFVTEAKKKKIKEHNDIIAFLSKS